MPAPISSSGVWDGTSLLSSTDMLRRSIPIIPTLFLLLTLTACEKDHLFDWTKSTGKTVTENRPAGNFRFIVMDDDVDIRLSIQPQPAMSVTAGQNIIDGIKTEVRNDTLYVSNENRCNWVRSYKNRYVVNVAAPVIDRLLYYGSGNFDCIDTIRTDEFIVDVWNGSGSIQLLLDVNQSHLNQHIGRCDITVAGRSPLTYVYQNDVGRIDAASLESDFTYARNTGTNDMLIRCNKELGVEIRYTGNIYCSGQPYRVDSDITGTGRLIF